MAVMAVMIITDYMILIYIYIYHDIMAVISIMIYIYISQYHQNIMIITDIYHDTDILMILI